MNIQIGGGRRMGKGELLHRYIELAKAQGHNVFELPAGIQGIEPTTVIVDELTLMRAHFEAMDSATRRAIEMMGRFAVAALRLDIKRQEKKTLGRERYLRRYRNIGLRRKR